MLKHTKYITDKIAHLLRTQALLSPVGAAAPCLVLVSGADETMAAGVDKTVIACRLAESIGANTKFVILPDAVHSLEGMENEAVRVMMEFVHAVST